MMGGMEKKQCGSFQPSESKEHSGTGSRTDCANAKVVTSN